MPLCFGLWLLMALPPLMDYMLLEDSDHVLSFCVLQTSPKQPDGVQYITNTYIYLWDGCWLNRKKQNKSPSFNNENMLTQKHVSLFALAASSFKLFQCPAAITLSR